jgi:hypothetical protein
MEFKPEYIKNRQDIPGEIPGEIPGVDKDENYSNTAGLGIAITISFLLIIIYSVVTASSTTKKIGSAVLSSGKKHFTVSQAVYYSAKPVTFITLIFFTALGMYMLYRKNFFESEILRIFVVLVYAALPIFFMAFTYIGPDQLLHYPMALTIFIGGTLTWLAVYMIYDKYFIDDQTLEELKRVVITMAIILFLLAILIIFNLYTVWNNRQPKNKRTKIPPPIVWFFNDLLAIGEYIHLSLYALLLYKLSTFKALPKLDELNKSNEPPI